jgi:hypothetical protein
MVGVLQIIGIGYIFLMIYLAFLYYKRNNYSTRSFLFWVVVWAFGLLLLLFPESASIITQRLKVARVTDFYLVLGLMFFSIITFLNYAKVKRTEDRVEQLVRSMALKRKK